MQTMHAGEAGSLAAREETARAKNFTAEHQRTDRSPTRRASSENLRTVSDESRYGLSRVDLGQATQGLRNDLCEPFRHFVSDRRSSYHRGHLSQSGLA